MALLSDTTKMLTSSRACICAIGYYYHCYHYVHKCLRVFAEVLDVYANAMTGTIPAALAKIPSLKEMDTHDNFFVGSMPQEICNKKLKFLASDCFGRKPEVTCACCTHCCEGLPYMRCVDMLTKEEVIIGADKNTKLPSRTSMKKK
jgi:hypothetical protein